VYTIVVASTFLFTSIVFVFASVVERRQDCYAGGGKERWVALERELNEFLAHEVRNPSLSHVGPELFTSAVNETAHISKGSSKHHCRGRRDHWLESSLH
jgi:hypothetical protein